MKYATNKHPIKIIYMKDSYVTKCTHVLTIFSEYKCDFWFNCPILPNSEAEKMKEGRDRVPYLIHRV